MPVARSDSITTPPVRVSFPNIFELKSVLGGTPARSIRIMIDKKNEKQMEWLKKFHNAMKKILVEQWPDEHVRPRNPLVGHDNSPIKDGDTATNQQGIPYKEKQPELENHYFFGASNYDEAPIPIVAKDLSAILNKHEIYGGCYCVVNVNAYARVRKDNPGISIGLNGVQKWADGEPFGKARKSAEAMFEKYDSFGEENTQVDSEECPF